MSVISTRPTEKLDRALRVAVVALSWLAVVLATSLLCRPWPGSEVMVPVVVAVAVAVVTLIGRPLSGALLLYCVTVLAMTLWGEVGGLLLVVSTVAALQLLPVRAVQLRREDR